jgi:hypothetical protein
VILHSPILRAEVKIGYALWRALGIAWRENERDNARNREKRIKKRGQNEFVLSFLERNKLLSALLLCNYFNTVVVSASLAYAVCKIYFAALGASNEVGGLLKLPNAGASFHLSRMRSFPLRNCHC